MAKRVEEAVLKFQDLLLLAVKEEKERKAILQKASFELERLKTYLRLCKDLEEELLALQEELVSRDYRPGKFCAETQKHEETL